MLISLIAFTQNGSALCKKLQLFLESMEHEVKAFAKEGYAKDLGLIPVTESLGQWTESQFHSCQGLIFIGAAGIAVRAIAPYVNNKKNDPAVLVLDEKGNYVIPILSGHIGGANELALTIAEGLGAVPVITTATDINHKFAVDVFARKNQLYIQRMDYAKEISAAILRGEPVGFFSVFDYQGVLSENLSLDPSCEYGICISFDEEKQPFGKTLQLIPQILTLGLGCRKGKTLSEIEAVVEKILLQNNISMHSLRNVATIDLKKEEKGLLEFCEKYQLELIIYTAEQLKQAKGNFLESDYVNTVTGIGNVCERAAVLGSGNGTVLQKKAADNGVTVSLARKEWSVQFE